MKAIVFSFFTFILFACKQSPEPVVIPTEQPILKVACIGDQITLGKYMKDSEADAYPVQLQQLLGDRFILQTFALKDATVLRQGDEPIWEDTIFRNAQNFQPDIVVLNLGINDTKLQNWWRYGDNFIHDYHALIDTFSTLETKPRLLLCRPARVFDLVDGINDSIMKIGVLPNIDTISSRYQLETVDLYQILAYRGDLFKNGIYPNKTANRIMAEMIYDKIISQAR